MAKGKVRAWVDGARRFADRFRRGSRRMTPVMFEELDRLAGRTTRIMAGVAPKDTGHLAREIHPEIVGGGFVLVSNVRSERGYSYTGVTRLGHRTEYIYPRKAKALRFVKGGRVIYAKRVRGYHPSRDWVEDGVPAAEVQADRSSQRVGRRITASMR